MSKLVTVKARPGDPIRFPNLCVNCAAEAQQIMEIERRAGRLTRLVEVPLCQACYRQLHLRSAREEQLQRLGRVLLFLFFAIALAAILLVTPASLGFALRAALAIALALLPTAVGYYFLQRALRQARLPQKVDVLSAVTIQEFTPQAVTFAFDNEDVAGQFLELNEPAPAEG